jgi:PAS domain S-box-containing protein
VRLGFQVIGWDWRYIYLNPAAAAHGQRTPEELVGRSMMDAYPGIEKTQMFVRLQACMTARTSDAFENLFACPDGSQRWFDIRVEPTDEGICVYSLDIHERKRHEVKD